MLKSGTKFFILKFTEPLQRCCCQVKKKICLEGLNWPGRLAGISEGARSVNFQKNRRPVFTIIFKSKMIMSRIEIFVHFLKEF